MQTCLEKTGIVKRNETIVRNDYTITDDYTPLHVDALSTGDPQGKGTGRGGHTHSTPDCNKPSSISYENFDTSERAGGLYDIEGRNGVGGRNFLMNISKYNAENAYGEHSVDTSANLADGQIRF